MTNMELREQNELVADAVIAMNAYKRKQKYLASFNVGDTVKVESSIYAEGKRSRVIHSNAKVVYVGKYYMTVEYKCPPILNSKSEVWREAIHICDILDVKRKKVGVA